MHCITYSSPLLDSYGSNRHRIPWFEQAPDGDGRAAFKALTDHYKGPAHQNLSAAEADAILETFHWKNEFVYPFDTYLTNLTKVFKSKQDASEEVPETMKVKEMLKRMKTDNPAVLVSMALVRLKHPEDFKSAGEEMATQIAQIFPRSMHEREKSGYTSNRKVAAMECDGVRQPSALATWYDSSVLHTNQPG